MSKSKEKKFGFELAEYISKQARGISYNDLLDGMFKALMTCLLVNLSEERLKGEDIKEMVNDISDRLFLQCRSFERDMERLIIEFSEENET